MHSKAASVLLGISRDQETDHIVVSDYETGGVYQIAGYCQIYQVIRLVNSINQCVMEWHILD